MLNIHYVTGSRADFGLMERCLTRLDRDPAITMSAVVTGQHLQAHYGSTISEVEASGISIHGTVRVALTGQDGAEMGRALGTELLGFIDLWETAPPDLVLVLGDRGEMLAATLAAVHLGIFVAHVHGGERSGTLDESFRHAITKLAHFHFAATREAAQRISDLGEHPDRIETIGAPGLVGIQEIGPISRAHLTDRFGLSPTSDVALLVFHPVVQQAGEAADQMRQVCETALAAGLSLVVMRPNSDAGGREIERYLDEVADDPRIAVATHLTRDDYLTLMASVDLVIGNSSSGIIESASLQVPCVNIGSRQHLRQRNDNTVDCPSTDPDDLAASYRTARRLNGPFINVYGVGDSDERMLSAVHSLVLDPNVLSKSNQF